MFSPLFIIGQPRSGTKLIRDLINRHPRVFIADKETHFLPYWISNWSSFGNLADETVFNDFYRSVTKGPYFHFMRNENRLIDPHIWYEGCKDYTVRGVFEALIRHDSSAGLREDVIWGDKSPSYLSRVIEIKTAFPTARFIHIVRDVRDYCVSLNKAYGKNYYRAAQRWKDEIKEARRQFSLIPGDVLEIRYEDLLSKPETIMRRISKFLEVEYDNRMTNLVRPSENKGDTIGRSEIVSSNKDKYIKTMRPRERKRVTNIAREILVAYEYQISEATKDERLSPLEENVYKIFDGVNLIKKGAGSNGILGALKFHYRSTFLTSYRD